MSQEPESPQKTIQQTVEQIVSLAQWVAELILYRKWSRLLVLTAVGFLFLLKPENQITAPGGIVLELLKILGVESFPSWYPLVFWGIEGVLFVTAVAVAMRTMPRATDIESADWTERKAIKGLRPFSREDADIFARLQRQRRLRECYEAVTSDSFRLGILVGDSGCGKTSFLQAGLWPKLSDSEGSHCGVYVRFTAQDPIEVFRKAVIDQMQIQPSVEQCHTEGGPEEGGEIVKQRFLALLSQLSHKAGKPVVLLLDQFEQFFVHYKRKSDREPFVQALTAWYRDADLPVKILISIRRDLYGRLVELQQALDCSLGPQEIFPLEKFEPIEATRILAVIAETERLKFDRHFVTELAAQELVSREDGLISPVDLQILAWMIERQNMEELRAFDQTAFQKFGGVEGLLMRFLDQMLKTRITTAQYQGALKVLLALTDLDRSVQAGVLTVPELQAKLKGTVNPGDVAEATGWLARGSVRLITPVEREDTIGYELAHERLIPALTRLAGKELSAADQANQLLERRVNEWLGNQRDVRYLLNCRELWLIKQQHPYLMWGAKRRQKEQLLAQSWKQVYGAVGVVAIVVLITMSFSSWLFYTPPGQIQQVRWALESPLGGPLERIQDAAVATKVAVAFAKDGQWSEAFKLGKRYVYRVDRDRAEFLKQLAEVTTKLENASQAQAQLDHALTVAAAIDDPGSKSDALRAISAAYGELSDAAAAQSVLAEAVSAAATIDDSEFKSYALREIATAAGGLSDAAAAQRVLAEVVSAAATIDDLWSKSDALREIATAYGELSDAAAAQSVLAEAVSAAAAIDAPGSKSYALRAIATAAGELSDTAAVQSVLVEAVSAAAAIDALGFKSDALSEIATAAGELSDTAAAQSVLAEAVSAVAAIDAPGFKSDALIEIAAAYGELSDTAAVHSVLAEAVSAAATIDDSRSKSDALREIATAAGELSDTAAAQSVLAEVVSAAARIGDPGPKFYALSAISAAYGELSDAAAAQSVLAEAVSAAARIGDPGPKFYALSAISVAYGELSDTAAAQSVLAEAVSAAATIDDSRSKSDALREIATAAGELSDTAAAQSVLAEVVSAAARIGDPGPKFYALRAIAAVYGELSDAAAAQSVLTEAVSAAARIDAPGPKFYALRAISAAAGELSDAAAAQSVLAEVVSAAATIDDLWSKSDALREIATAYGELSDAAAAQSVLAEAVSAAARIDAPGSKSEALREIAAAAGELSDAAAAQSVLAEVVSAAATIDDSESKFYALREIAAAAGELSDAAAVRAVLEGVLTEAESANDSMTLRMIGIQYAKLEAWGKALRALKNCNDQEKVVALMQILTLWAEKRNPELIAGAVVLEIEHGGTPGSYTFDVTIRSPDKGCNLYADWWEVLSENGELLDREVFNKSHVDDQPFQSSSKHPLDIQPDQVVIIRAHMNEGGYTDQVQRGSVKRGFTSIRLSENFARRVAQVDPQPPTCND